VAYFNKENGDEKGEARQQKYFDKLTKEMKMND
jgi:hypothetical protein